MVQIKVFVFNGRTIVRGIERPKEQKMAINPETSSNRKLFITLRMKDGENRI